jgi:hypothetical protein
MIRQSEAYKIVKKILKPLYLPIDYFRSGKAKKKLSATLVKNKINPDELDSPFFIVATRGNLHVVQTCLKFIPSDQDSVMVLNGLERWEQDWARSHLRSKGFITFPYLIDHWMVIDYLLKWMNKPFGLLDEDCFVFDSDCFKKLIHIPEKTVMSSYYSYTNSKLGLTFPETMFLFLNTPVINKLNRHYNIDSKVVNWNELSTAVRNKLLTIGISDQNLPEDYKPYFDTLRGIMATGLAEGYQFYYPDGDHSLRAEKLYHIGAVASVPLRGVRLQKYDHARGAYFWYRALELFTDEDIKIKYFEKYGRKNSTEILDQIPNSIKDMFLRNDFLSSVERILSS